MLGTSEKVVVRTRLLIEERGDGAMFAAHLDAVGLTAYGHTIDEAGDSVKRLFNTWVTQCREHGILETRLDALGAEWSYLGDYDGAEPVEETSARAAGQEKPYAQKGKSESYGYSLAMAA